MSTATPACPRRHRPRRRRAAEEGQERAALHHVADHSITSSGRTSCTPMPTTRGQEHSFLLRQFHPFRNVVGLGHLWGWLMGDDILNHPFKV